MYHTPVDCLVHEVDPGARWEYGGYGISYDRIKGLADADPTAQFVQQYIDPNVPDVPLWMISRLSS